MLSWYTQKGYLFSVSEEEKALMCEPLDFLGINYYSRHVVQHGQEDPLLEIAQVKPKESEYTDMGWEVYPPGLFEIVERVFREYAPRKILITENGIALKDELKEGKIEDRARIRFIEEHLRYLYKAIQKGYPVRGYFVWSLLDNFEWAWGFSKRFGLVFVDYQTRKRIPKESFYFYKRAIKMGIEEENQ